MRRFGADVESSPSAFDAWSEDAMQRRASSRARTEDGGSGGE